MESNVSAHEKPDIHAAITTSLTDLPSPPVVAMEIIRLTRDQDSSAGDLAAVLSQDPVLAARVLQIANSPAYGLATPVTSIDRATALLGLKAVKMMALSFSLAAEVPAELGALSIDTYWYHSLLNAVAGRRWAELIEPGIADEAFLAGLLSHLGRLVLAQDQPDKFAKTLAPADDGWPTHAAETAVFGFSSADVTVVVLELWGLPPIVLEAIGAMYCNSTPNPEVNGAEGLAEVMKHVELTEAAAAGEDGRPDELAEALSQHFEADGVEAIVRDLDERLHGVADMLDVQLPAAMSHQELVAAARTELVAVSIEAMQNLHVVELEAQELRSSNEQLEGMAYEDRLTAVPNRAAFDDYLSRMIAGATREGGGNVGMLLFDIDHFKKFNDTYGHQIGDDVLHAVAQAASSVVRANELFARYGGEEFALIATNCAVSDMVVTGERVRQVVESLRVPSPQGDLAVTISGGAAVIDVHDRDAGERLIKLADEALYRAKELGRNQIRAAD